MSPAPLSPTGNSFSESPPPLPLSILPTLLPNRHRRHAALQVLHHLKTGNAFGRFIFRRRRRHPVNTAAPHVHIRGHRARHHEAAAERSRPRIRPDFLRAVRGAPAVAIRRRRAQAQGRHGDEPPAHCSSPAAAGPSVEDLREQVH